MIILQGGTMGFVYWAIGFIVFLFVVWLFLRMYRLRRKKSSERRGRYFRSRIREKDLSSK